MDVDPAEAVPNNDEDDDPVVEEIPVYLSKSVNCYLFQYPVRPATLSYDNSQVTRARFRPSNKQVQLEIKLNTNSENYDQSKGEQIAINTDGCGSSSEKYFKSNRMDKQVLVGQSGGCGSGRYSVAKLTEDRQLHLTEIQGILQVRPSLNYMDKSDRIAKQEGKFKDEPDDPDMEEEKPQAVTVRFSRVSCSSFLWFAFICIFDSGWLGSRSKDERKELRLPDEEGGGGAVGGMWF